MIRAQLHVTGPGMNRLFVLQEGDTHIGREFSNEIWLDHPLLAPQHITVSWQDGDASLKPHENNRGTRLNGQLLVAEETLPIYSGDVILAHPFTLSFTIVTVVTGLEGAPAELLGEDGDGEAESALFGAEDDQADLSTLPSAIMLGPPDEFDYAAVAPPGLGYRSIRYINYLPDIYKNDFVSRFLAMLEAVLMPVEWTVANIDLQLDPHTALPSFLPWLASWFGVTFDSTWTEEMQREFLAEAHQLFAMRGTKWAMARTLEIYTGHEVEIFDLIEEENPFLFTIKFPCGEGEVRRDLIEKIIQIDKPAHTTYTLDFVKTEIELMEGITG